MRRSQIKESDLFSIMKRVCAVLVMCSLMAMGALPAQAGSATGGEDVNPDGNAPFTVKERTTPSQDGQAWQLKVALNQEATDNGTTLAITTQICTNDGVCDPPTLQEATVSDDGQTYSMELTPPTDHTYVNWRVKATYDDDSTENFPAGDWYKTWSTCYYDDGTFGGVHATSDGCDVPASGESEGFLPGFGMLTVLGTLVAAAAVVQRRIR